MAIQSVKVLYPTGDLSEVRVVVGEEYPTLPVKAVAFPRHNLDLVREWGAMEDDAVEGIPDISWPGVYLLLGPSVEDPRRSYAYIGHSESVFQRLYHHHSNPSRGAAPSPHEWWTDTIVFVAANSAGLNKAHIAQLESCLIRSAKDVNNARWIVPKTKPSKDAGKLSPRVQKAMNSLALDMEIVVNVMGWDLFRKPHCDVVQFMPPQNTDSSALDAAEASNLPKFVFKGKLFSATMRISDSGKFTVEKGSKARADMPMLYRGVALERRKLVEEGILQKKGKYLVFTEDYDFSSVSRAASVVSGQNRNGNTAWESCDGQGPYGQWLEQQTVQSALGRQTFNLNPAKQNDAWKSPVFCYRTNSDAFAATMQMNISGEFVVKKGSKAKLQTSPSTSSGVISERERLLNEKFLEEKITHLVFKENCSFPSARLSASVVRGHDVNGKTAWKLTDGRTLGQWLETEDLKRGIT